MVVYRFTEEFNGVDNIDLSIDTIKKYVGGDFSFKCIKDDLFVLFNAESLDLKPTLLIRGGNELFNESIIKGGCLIVKLSKDCRDNKGLIDLCDNSSFRDLSVMDINYINENLIHLTDELLIKLGLLYLEQSISKDDADFEV